MFTVRQYDHQIQVCLGLYTKRAVDAVNFFMDELFKADPTYRLRLFDQSPYTKWCGICSDGEITLVQTLNMQSGGSFPVMHFKNMFKEALELLEYEKSEENKDARVVLRGLIASRSRKPTKKFKTIAGTPFDPFVQMKLEMLLKKTQNIIYDFSESMQLERDINEAIEEGWRTQGW